MELSPILLICIFKIFAEFVFQDATILHSKSLFRVLIANKDYERLFNVTANLKLIFFVIFILVADGVRYRPIIILGSISALLKYLMMFFPPSPFTLYVAMISQAFSVISMKAILPYMFAITESSKYQKITAYVIAAAYLGSSFTDVWSVFYYTHTQQIEFLDQTPIYIHTIFLCIIIPCSYILPPVESKRIHHIGEGFENLIEDDTTNIADTADKNQSIQGKLLTGMIHLWVNFKTAYTNYNVLRWSLWYSTTASMYPVIQLYSVILLETSAANGSSEISYFSFTNQFLNWCGNVIITISIILCSLKPTDWKTRGDTILCSVSFILAALTILLHFYVHQFIHVINLEIFRVIAAVFLGISLWEIGQEIPKNSYGLVIGFNAFMTHLLRKIISPDFLSDVLDLEGILIHAALFALLGLWFGLLAKSVFGKK